MRKYNQKQIKLSNSSYFINIDITPLENQIFNFIISVKKYFNINTEFRVAGGWVRDKLLEKNSDDIDIALTDITGRDFVNYILKMPNAENIIGKDYKVPINVEKSKHLETATIELFKQKIDFVNLRSETYGKSRIPTMEMGMKQLFNLIKNI